MCNTTLPRPTLIAALNSGRVGAGLSFKETNVAIPRKTRIKRDKARLAADAKRLRHCKVCGKFSRNIIGEYIRKDGSVGYINQEEGETGATCTDCREKPTQFRIVNNQFGYPMYAAYLSLGTPPWTDRIEEAHVYDHRDNRETKLKYWRAIASNSGLDPAAVVAVPA